MKSYISPSYKLKNFSRIFMHILVLKINSFLKEADMRKYLYTLLATLIVSGHAMAETIIIEKNNYWENRWEGSNGVIYEKNRFREDRWDATDGMTLEKNPYWDNRWER